MTSPEQNPWGGPTDEAILDAVRDAYEARETDLLDGGVPPSAVAARVDTTREHAQDRLVDLADADELVRVHGANPETFRSRPSYLLPEHTEPNSDFSL